ncbi:histone acetyltransferase [Saccharomycopsis crataegensis]|uniref:Histone acetyltransferase n=1 Tax=Saccharomycopsis crataegensis TaxID=43959 RepID=A0AAV5QR60_9ASCO|nr:histone acetyltransferase [Saccharomycopsis crataegensis]
MQIEIRPVAESDHDEWLRLFNLYLVFYKASLPEETKEFTFRRLLDPAIPMWSALAIHPETKKPIGLANYLQHLATWSTEDMIYLNDLYVDEKQRLKNVGKQLIEYVYKKADELGAPVVYWSTDFDNHRAQLLYTKVGVRTNKVKYFRSPETY